MTRSLTRGLLGSVPIAGLVTGIACAPLTRSQRPNAIGVHIVNAAGGPRCEGPKGVFGGFRESDVLIDGTNTASGRSDVVVGPMMNLGFGYWITADLIFRGDLYGTFAKPELSFPWNRFGSFAGIGLVKIF